VLFPGDTATSLEQLRLAVPGLAGLAGFVLFPTFGSWFRLALETMEAGRAHLGRPRRVSTLSGMRAGLITLAFGFFVLTLFRAAGELRAVETEAAVVGPSIQGAVIGVAFWIVYGLGISALRADAARLRGDRRIDFTLR